MDLFLKKLFIYFWLRWVFVAVWALSSFGERGLLFIAVHGLLIVVASLFFLIFFRASGNYSFVFFILFFIIYLFIIYGCVGSLFLCEGFLQLWQVGATPHCDARASHYRGLSCCGAQAPDAQAQ